MGDGHGGGIQTGAVLLSNGKEDLCFIVGNFYVGDGWQDLPGLEGVNTNGTRLGIFSRFEWPQNSNCHLGGGYWYVPGRQHELVLNERPGWLTPVMYDNSLGFCYAGKGVHDVDPSFPPGAVMECRVAPGEEVCDCNDPDAPTPTGGGTSFSGIQHVPTGSCLDVGYPAAANFSVNYGPGVLPCVLGGQIFYGDCFQSNIICIDEPVRCWHVLVQASEIIVSVGIDTCQVFMSIEGRINISDTPYLQLEGECYTANGCPFTAFQPVFAGGGFATGGLGTSIFGGPYPNVLDSGFFGGIGSGFVGY